MVKPSLKTTSFKHHPVYIQKSLHVDNPFYGPKPMYQRAEVIPGGDCEVVDLVWLEDADDVWDVTLDESVYRVDAGSILMTKADTGNGSIYLPLSSPIDLSWAKYVGFWYQGLQAQIYAANDIYFYIYTASGNYAYANAARYVDPIGGYTEVAGTAVWHYAEVKLDDFIMASGYETDMLERVWGIGFYANTIGTGQTMNIDQIEFYTVGTGLGPARGLIESVPLYDEVHAVRGYGLAWNENSGRVDISALNDYAFAGICTGNPSRTKLSRDITGGNGDTELHLLDPSLFESGPGTRKATIAEPVTPASEIVTITAVDLPNRTITVTPAIIAETYTVANNAYICMMGNEEGTIRVDVLVDGIVNVKAHEIVNEGYGAKCYAVGDAITGFTVNEVNLNEEGMTIGKCMADCAAEEDFPIKLTADARTA